MKDEEDKNTADKRRRANIANARASTGPRSQAGKGRSSKNSVSHGLSAVTKSLCSNGAITWGERIAASLNDESDEIVILAAAVAAEQLELVRVRRARLLLKSENFRNREDKPFEHQHAQASSLIQELRVDRYERRAMSRRKRAIAALGAALTSREVK